MWVADMQKDLESWDPGILALALLPGEAPSVGILLLLNSDPG